MSDTEIRRFNHRHSIPCSLLDELLNFQKITMAQIMVFVIWPLFFCHRTHGNVEKIENRWKTWLEIVKHADSWKMLDA
uniref:Uncharacterized protein n=1 Tax=Caenorhabditis japonica TaxID=281687 RepID=A0A8R1IL35_CAEJA